MPTRITISNLGASILADPAPILFLDTSSVLDIIRLPNRANGASFARGELVAINKIITLNRETPRKLWLVFAPEIPDEWRDNVDNVKNETDKFLKKQDKLNNTSSEIANQVGLTLPSTPSYHRSDILKELVELSKTVLNESQWLTQSKKCTSNAYKRVINKTAPSNQGREMKDCSIYEHILEVMNGLRAGGFTDLCVFQTSNTRDYYSSTAAGLKPPLDTEVASVNLTVDTSWALTARELGI